MSVKIKPFDFKNEKYHLGHLFMDSVRSSPDVINQIDAATGESETNASVLKRVVQFARCCRRLGTKPGDVLALGGSNHLDLHIPFFAALINGMPVSGVDPLFKFAQIKAHFKVSSPKIAFCQQEHLDDYIRATEELGLDTKLICFDEGEYSLKRFIEEYDDLNNEEEIQPLDFDQNKIYAWLVSTGGTTGVLKLAAFTHRSFLLKLLAFQKSSHKEFQVPTGKLVTSILLSPVQWISSFFNVALLPLLKVTKLVTSAPATTDHIIDMINKYKPVTTTLGPFLATAILKSEKKCDLTCFQNILLTGSKIPKDMQIKLRARMRPDAALIEAYGQTENLGPVIMPNPHGPIGNCGRGVYDGHELKLMDPETGKEITEPNVPGEMWTKGPCFSEYYKNPEETASAFTQDGWFRTGDQLYVDEDGNYFFVERIKMLIKFRNYHIIPPEIEAVIREHDGVKDVSVTSIPHEMDGEHPVACVVRNKGSNVTAQQIKDYVASKLSDTQQLRGGVVFMDEIPLTSTMKVARGDLRQLVLKAHRE